MGLNSKLLQLCFTMEDCKIDLINDICFNLFDQYACATFKRANCKIVNRQTEMLQCFSDRNVP